MFSRLKPGGSSGCIRRDLETRRESILVPVQNRSLNARSFETAIIHDVHRVFVKSALPTGLRADAYSGILKTPLKLDRSPGVKLRTLVTFQSYGAYR